MSLNANKKTPSVNITVEGGFDFWAAPEKKKIQKHVMTIYVF